MLTAVELPPLPAAAAPQHDDGRTWVVLDDGSALAGAVAKALAARCAAVRRVSADSNDWPAEATLGGVVLFLPASPVARWPLWKAESETAAKRAFAFLQRAAAGLRASAPRGRSLLASVARLDGCFGLNGGEFDPMQGALAGLVKTAEREWPEVRCRALDVSATWTDAEAAANAVAAELFAEGPQEVGLSPRRRVGLRVEARPVRACGLPLSEGDVVVVTGGARGVTAEAAAALARRCRVRLALLGRSPPPTNDPPWLAGLVDEAAIKRAIFARASAGGAASLRPAELQAEYERLTANRQVRATLERIRAAGGAVEYFSVDVRDEEAVGRILHGIRAGWGPVRGLVHAAGVIHDRRIEDKSAAQFEAVFDTKVGGLRCVLAALEPAELRVLALYSSVTGRFGRAGQADYAMANEVLNKAAAALSRRLPHCRVVALNWGPWDGGMVGHALRREFERQGVPLIPLVQGAAAFVSELEAEREAVEVVLGAPFEARPAAEPSSAVDAPPAADAAPAAFRAPGARAAGPTVWEVVLDPRDSPWMDDHRLNGRPVVPLALVAEWLAAAATRVQPDLALAGFDDLRVLRGLVMDTQRFVLRCVAAPVERTDGFVRVPLELRGARDELYARAGVLLSESPLEPQECAAQGEAEGPGWTPAGPLYRDVLFHGPWFQAIEATSALDENTLVARVRAAPPPREWMRSPHSETWWIDPLMLDAALQLGIVWCHARLGSLCLPARIGVYRQHGRAPTAGGGTVRLEVRRAARHQLSADATLFAVDGSAVAQLTACEWTIDAGLRKAFGRRADRAGAAEAVGS